ncbi:MAG TPA: UDP-3-O-acyl-N-acetylglucosamine deacetylase [Gemmatimonadales bacterium]|jgi:UDP-3-O-[3-hydroxymyristoyl] N-acetylglucosamine deacetylase/3-hydroxyacyl-[acyl-carrier-protein] dehydratase
MTRRTIAAEATLSGVGLHTGAATRVRCRPGRSEQGVVFRRVDLPGAPEIPARVSEVSDTERRTVIGTGAACIHTVEHLLAAVAALELDDLLIELDGPEPPILDGSFAPYLDLLEGAGIAALPGEPVCYEVCHPIDLSEGEAGYAVRPAAGLRLSTMIEWSHPLIGRQSGSWEITPATFRAELAAARTFGFTSEVDALRERGLLKGATLQSAVVLSEDAVVGTTLRWPDEFLRHKTGDILGDLALVGGRVRAHITATRPSHRGNVALARAIVRTTAQRGGRMLDIQRIMEVLPHRYPILLVDRILELTPRKRVVGIKNVTINDPFFQGHFPGHPIMPGVLIVEAMAQVGGMLLMEELLEGPPKVVYFMALDNVKFRRPVIPGDQLRSEVEIVQLRGRNCRLKGVAYVAGQVVAEAEMLARVVDR